MRLASFFGMALQHDMCEIKVCSSWIGSERCQGFSVAAHRRGRGLGGGTSGFSYLDPDTSALVCIYHASVCY
jgi:hypothetical protein